MKRARRSLRAEMPGVAAFVDSLREAFGEETVNRWLRGEDSGWLCAEENGQRWCTPGRTCARCREGKQ